MGTITDENRRALEEADNYEDAILNGMDDQHFCKVFSDIFDAKNISVMDIVGHADVSKAYVNKLRSYATDVKRPGRGKIIDIALAMNTSYEELNALLKAARLQELYSRDSAEALIIWGLKKGKSGQGIREMLYEKGLEDVFQKS